MCARNASRLQCGSATQPRTLHASWNSSQSRGPGSAHTPGKEMIQELVSVEIILQFCLPHTSSSDSGLRNLIHLISFMAFLKNSSDHCLLYYLFGYMFVVCITHWNVSSLRTKNLSCTPLYPHLEQSLANSRHSTNFCWMREFSLNPQGKNV